MASPISRQFSYAILADGGFVQRRLGTPDSPMDIARFRGFVRGLRNHPLLRNHRLLRVHYYDAHPLPTSLDSAGPQPASNMKALHDELSRMPFVSLRLGELRLRKNRREVRGPIPDPVNGEVTVKAGRLGPAIRQKGVDMRLGLDIAALTLKKQAEIIVLVTGDSDFIPAMKFARREGAQVFLAPLGAGIRNAMREHADLILAVKPPPVS